MPLPSEKERASFIRASTGAAAIGDFSDFGADDLAKLTAGISLTDLNVLIQSARESPSGRSILSLAMRRRRHVFVRMRRC